MADIRETEIDLIIETLGPEQIHALLGAIGAKACLARSFAFD